MSAEVVMTNRPVPRWLHVWAIVTVAATAALLTLGGLVTTFRAGMADPIWPTTPWYLFFIDWSEPAPGYLIEHSHRLAGFIVGGVASILTIGLWLTDPRAWSRWLGFVGLIVLLGAFGLFHGLMMKQVKEPQIVVPFATVGTMAAALGLLLMCAFSGLATGSRGAGLRLLGIVSLVAVMVQGLLGGLRVRLNVWAGADLAPAHGVFAQVVFCCLVALAVLTARPVAVPEVSDADRRRCRRHARYLTALVFLQLIWGALVRHNPTSTVQRLHLITAFAVVGSAVWLIRTAQATALWPRLRRASVILGTFLSLQIVFGVEAWMGKFASEVLPELQKITPGLAIVRTAHVLIGTGILAVSVAFVLLTRRPCLSSSALPVTPDQRPKEMETHRPTLAGLHQLGGAT